MMFILFLLLTGFSPLLWAAAGDLDKSFNSDGKLTINFGTPWDYGTSIAIQPDGKIVVAGRVKNPNGNHSDIAVARLLPNGDPDPGFGPNSNGQVTIDVNGGYDQALDIELQNDGKIVLAGSCCSPVTPTLEFVLVRLNTDGSLDATFDGDGIVTTDFGGTDDQAFGVAIASGGVIVAVGSTFLNGINDFAVARYTMNGALDQGFDGDGKVTTAFGNGSNEYADDVIIQPDGKIVAAGFTNVNPDPNVSKEFALVRYLTTGALDTGFGLGGKVNAPEGEGHAIVIQPDGKLLVAGATPGDFGVVRYHINGIPDSTFSSDALATADFGGEENAHALVLQADSKIVAAGYVKIGENYDFALARFLPNGVRDITFNNDGKVITDFSTFGLAGDKAYAIAIQHPAGRIVVVGGTSISNSSDFALARYHAYTCEGKDVTVLGGVSNDTLYGTFGADVILGLGGDDAIYSNLGDDTICGDSGNDSMNGGGGSSDACSGGSGAGDTAINCEIITGVP